MRMGKYLAVGIAAITVVAVAAPADAQRYRGRYHQRDRVDGGDVLLGAVLAGGLIALISSANKAERDRREAEAEPYYEDAPPPPVRDWRSNDSEAEAYDAPEAGDGYDDAPSGYADVRTEDGAVDACAAAALSEGQRHSRIVNVGSIEAVDPAGANWSVRGSLLLRDDYRDRGSEHTFRCTIAGAGAPSVRIDGFAQ